MKPIHVILITIVTAILASFVTVKTIAPQTSVTSKTESAYDRVMRTGTIRCGYMPWPPYFQKNEKTSELTGMVKEAVDAMFLTMDIKIEYIEAVLGQQPQDLKSGKYDSFCFDSFLTPKAAKFLDYSKPWMKAPMFLYGREGFDKPTSREGLDSSDYSFSAMDGDLSSDLALRFFPTAKMLSLPATADPSLLMLNLATAKSDIVIIDPLSISKFNATNDKKLSKLYDKPIAVYPINFSINKGEVDLQNLINYAVDIFVHTGKYQQLFEKYDPTHEAFVQIEK